MTIDWDAVVLVMTAVCGGGGLIKLFEWWGGRRSVDAAADSVVIENTKALVEMLRRDVAETRARCDVQDDEIRELRGALREVTDKQAEMLRGCQILVDQLREHDIEPAWEPPESAA